jgi:hypothetical protein
MKHSCVWAVFVFSSLPFCPLTLSTISFRTRYSSTFTLSNAYSYFSFFFLLSSCAQVAFSFTPLIDWAAHLGGLVGGALLGGWFFAPGCSTLLSTGRTRTTMSICSLLVFLCLSSFLLAMLYVGGVVPITPTLRDFCRWEQLAYPAYNIQCPF